MTLQINMFCFVHIEKAAGTTFHTILLNNFASYTVVTPWSYWSNDDKNIFLEEEVLALRKIMKFSKGFGGHSVRSYLRYENILEQPIQYITFLREPISRYLSHYNYQKNVMKIDITFEDYLNESRFSNFMTKRIGGCYDIRQAKKNLIKQFSFVGLVEHFDESLLLLNDIVFGGSLDVLYEKKNVAKNDDKIISIDTYTEQIKSNNCLDIDLYEFAKTSLYPQFVKQYTGHLQEDLVAFSDFRASRCVKRSFGHRILSRVYDGIFQNLERKVHRQYHDSTHDYR